ncbi:50S ribosomal protein L13 [Candidatus Pacearchaeota archaeon]|nr:50S ribosomal protein L13 [Candidatus Pacearchaeota archaeon]
MEKIYIDSDNAVMGRIVSFAAKQALQGKEVAILNCEKALISGNKSNVIERLKLRRGINSMKPRKGPFYSKDSQLIMKRCVRGMLPDWRNGRGKEALKKIKCYKGLPEEFKKEKIIKIKTNVPSKAITVEELSLRV